MDGGDSSLSGIDEKNGNTVGGLDAEEKAGLVCDTGVSAAGVSRSSFEHVHDVGVKLFQGDKGKMGSAESRLEAAAIFQDVFARVTFGETEIEDLFDFSQRDRGAADQSADAAGPRAEAVDQPGQFAQGLDPEDTHAARGAPGPRAWR
jgi:hypothetical protein